MKVLAILTAVAIAAAQDAEKPGSIEGVVRGEGDGPAIADIEVRAGRIQTRTDSSGQYALHGVPPGRQQVNVGVPARGSVAFGSRTVTVAPGQSVISNFSVPLKGTISGTVLDNNDEPVAGVEVVLIAREYEAGAIRYFRRNVAFTGDEGEYRMEFVQPGVPYLVLFRQTELRKLNPVSEAPTELRLRRPAIVPSYYPGAIEPEGATPITLRRGEHREGVNGRLLQTASYCIEAVLTAGGRPASMTFQIHEAHLSFGIGPSGGVTGMPPHGDSGPDGRIRICDLHPGDYRLSALSGDVNHPDALATIPISIADRDVMNATLQPVPRLSPLQVELAWAEPPPAKPAEVKVGVVLNSMTRSFGAFAASGREAPPSRLMIKDSAPGAPGLLMDDYYLRVTGLNERAYVKQIVYGAEDLTRAPLRLGSAAAGISLRIVVGHDGGFLHARVTDRDDSPISDAMVFIMPMSAGSDGEFAALLVTGQADQDGDYVSRALAPGKYLVVATVTPANNLTPEFVSKLRLVRNRAEEISVDPNATVDLRLWPIDLP